MHSYSNVIDGAIDYNKSSVYGDFNGKPRAFVTVDIFSCGHNGCYERPRELGDDDKVAHLPVNSTETHEKLAGCNVMSTAGSILNFDGPTLEGDACCS